ncbi:hypothetical protein MMC14_005503 [Varicellaria rhodocarpa]|nr:hypothetical protein [Varicellaria rhodocarpa]
MASAPTASDILFMEAHIRENKIPSIVTANVICIIAAYLAVVLRFISRRFVQAKLGPDDWWIVGALLVYTGFIIGFSLSTLWGAGFTNVKKDNIADEVLYCAVILCIKFSIILLYRRIFPQRWFKIALILLGLFITVWAVTAAFLGIFQCVPISFAWNPKQPGHYIYYGKVVLGIGIINVVTDFIILGFPVPLIWKLMISKQQKLLLTVTLMMGGSACIISIVRLFYAQIVGSSVDPSWNDVNGGILSTAELCVRIAAACIPTYRPLFNRLIHGSAIQSGRQADLEYLRHISAAGREGEQTKRIAN